MKILLGYLLAVNLAGYLLMGADKRKARRGAWRVSEKTLLLIAALGGSVGVLAGMERFHHKTLHKKFTWGVPAILMAQVLAAGGLVLLWSRWAI